VWRRLPEQARIACALEDDFEGVGVQYAGFSKKMMQTSDGSLHLSAGHDAGHS